MLIPASYVKEASLTKTYVYWEETDRTIHSSVRSLKRIRYCTVDHLQPAWLATVASSVSKLKSSDI